MITGEEARHIAKQMFLNNIEELVKHHVKLQKMYRTKDLSPENVRKWHKEELNLCYIAYPEIEAMRSFIEKEYPEFIYMVDHIETTIKSHESEE
jgi:translation initiation factor 2B subunit (eIF-2B alpha/beta/delta family)